jgi:hypothetical protein
LRHCSPNSCMCSKGGLIDRLRYFKADGLGWLTVAECCIALWLREILVNAAEVERSKVCPVNFDGLIYSILVTKRVIFGPWGQYR